MPAPHRVVALQGLLTLLAAAVGAVVDPAQGKAALLAGAAVLGPTAWYARQTGRQRSPGRLLGQGVARMLATVALMAAVIVAFEPAAAGFFATLILLQLAYLAALVGTDGTAESGGRRAGLRRG